MTSDQKTPPTLGEGSREAINPPPPNLEAGRNTEAGGETAASIAAWADAAFGPVQTWASIAARANRELAELIQALADDPRHPKAAEETADVVICLYRLVHEAGFDLQSEIDRKMAINRNRKWVTDGNGHGQHVPEGGAA